MLDAAADRYSLPRALLRGVAWVESRGNPLARSPQGAIGVMQLMPQTAQQLGVDPHDPAQNIDGGARYLAMLLTKYQGDTVSALAAYVWGPGRVDKHATWPQSVVEYIAHVNARMIAEGGRPAGRPFTGAPQSSSSSQPQSSSPRIGDGGRDDS